MSGGLKKLEKEDLYFSNATAMEVLKEFIGYPVDWDEVGDRTYVEETEMHLARLMHDWACSNDDGH